MTLIQTVPWSRINDTWIITDRVDATPVDRDVTHELVPVWNTSNQHVPMTDYQYAPAWFKHTALDIVTESVYHYPRIYITSKVFKSINCKRMFVIVGAPYSLKYLRELGFETFSDIIDESYDEQTDPEERFLSIIKSVEDFCSLDIEYIKNYYVQNAKKFSHNWHTAKNLQMSELEKIKQKLESPAC